MEIRRSIPKIEETRPQSSDSIESSDFASILSASKMPAYTFAGKKLDSLDFNTLDIDAISQRIQELRRHGYVHLILGDPNKPNHRNIYIAHGESSSTHEYENEIQALRYFKGMLIIANHCDDDLPMKLHPGLVIDIFKKYAQSPMPAKEVHKLAEEFALLLESTFEVSIEDARKQVTMARDLGILLEDHPEISTVSKNDDQITIELSRNLKVSKRFYDTEFDIDVPVKRWFHSALKFAGFRTREREYWTTWLHDFFQDADVIDQLQQKGVSAPPSARWLPLPGNLQAVEVMTGKYQEDEIANPSISRFTRVGTISAFAISDINEQKRLAKKILIEIINQQVNQAISQYKLKYKKLSRSTYQLPVGTYHRVHFFINYQTLLSPHHMEPLLYKWGHQDNNGAFVVMAKKAMKQIETEIKLNPEHRDVDLHFCHTNSAINSLAGWVSIKEYEKDNATRKSKLNAVADLVQRIDPYNSLIAIIRGESATPGVIELELQLNNIKQQLKKLVAARELNEQTLNEILLRIRAAVHLRLLLENKHPRKDLPVYQFNIMQASLEFLTQGDQGVSLAGCKSARDRTAIFAAAVKTMQENPHAMDNWECLNAGILTSLKQGHHFRAMSYHVAMVKVKDVHDDFMGQLDVETQKGIKDIKIFSKTLGAIKVAQQAVGLRTSKSLRGKEELQSSSSHQQAPIKTQSALLMRENLAIENLKRFKVKMDAYVQRLQNSKADLLGTVTDKIRHQNTKNFITKFFNRNLAMEFTQADHRKQTFHEAWQHIAMITPIRLLGDLGVDAVASLENIKHFIDTTTWHTKGLKFFVGEQPKHVKRIRDLIKEFDVQKHQIEDINQVAYNVLKDVLATAYTAAKIGDDVLRHRETQKFYLNISQYLIPKKIGQYLSNR